MEKSPCRAAPAWLCPVPLHIIQRGNNRQACFYADEDYRFISTGYASTQIKPDARFTLRPHDQPRSPADFGATPLRTCILSYGASREAAYRELFRYELEPGLVDEIRRAMNGNFALENATFAAQVTSALGRRAVPGKSGRPRRTVEVDSGELFGE